MELKRKRSAGATLTDESIIGLFFDRNEKAIEATDAKYGKYLFSVAYNVLGDRLDSEECLSDTYLGVWNAIPPARPVSLRAFLTAVARHLAVKRYHSSRRKKIIPSEMTVSLSELEGMVSEDGNAEAEFNAERLGNIISGFINSLSERRQYIFVSRYYAAESIDRIASDLNVSRSTVNKELAAIRYLLKEKLESEGYPI